MRIGTQQRNPDSPNIDLYCVVYCWAVCWNNHTLVWTAAKLPSLKAPLDYTHAVHPDAHITGLNVWKIISLLRKSSFLQQGLPRAERLLCSEGIVKTSRCASEVWQFFNLACHKMGNIQPDSIWGVQNAPWGILLEHFVNWSTGPKLWGCCCTVELLSYETQQWQNQ